MSEKQWSSYQKAIFDEVQNGKNNIVVEALAGSGKTSSLVESLKYVPSGLSWLLVAFNKKIADELKYRVTWGGEISTLHSLGLKSLFKTFPKVSVDQNKVDDILLKLLGKKKDNKEAYHSLTQAVRLSKGYLAHTFKEIDDVLDEHDIDCGDLERSKFINHVLFILDICKKQTDKVDFDDMVWLSNVIKTKVAKFDRVFVDEAQDLNFASMGLIQQTLKENSKIIFFQDVNQAIYGWRGSNSQSVIEIQNQLNAKVLDLPITYRCPLFVVKEAQKLVPKLQAAPNAIEGKVSYISMSEMKKTAKPGCFILSRVNAPLISLVFTFLKQGIPANIQGRDLGNNLLSMIKTSRAKTIDKFQIYLKKWSQKEIKRLTDAGKDTEHILDKLDCFNALMENCNTIPELKSTIGKLFEDTDDHGRIVLSSTHRAKGFERDVVYMLLGTYRMTNQEEKNIKYVAITRSARELYYVLSDKSVKNQEE